MILKQLQDRLARARGHLLGVTLERLTRTPTLTLLLEHDKIVEALKELLTEDTEIIEPKEEEQYDGS